MDGSRFSSQGCCPTVVGKRERDGVGCEYCVSYVHDRALSQPFLGDVCLVWSAKGQQYTVIRWEVMWKRQPLHALKCATKEISVTKCRVEYRHHSTNGMKTLPVTNGMGDTFVTCWKTQIQMSDWWGLTSQTGTTKFFCVCLVLRVTCKPCPPHIISVRWLWVPNPHGNCHNHQTLHNKLHERCKDELFQ